MGSLNKAKSLFRTIHDAASATFGRLDPFNGNPHGLMPSKGETPIARSMRLSAEYRRQAGYLDGVTSSPKAMPDDEYYLRGYARGCEDYLPYQEGYEAGYRGMAKTGSEAPAFHAGYDRGRIASGR